MPLKATPHFGTPYDIKIYVICDNWAKFRPLVIDVLKFSIAALTNTQYSEDEQCRILAKHLAVIISHRTFGVL